MPNKPLPRGSLSARLASLDRAPVWSFGVAAAVIYGLLALAAYFPSWPGDPHRLPLCACGDTVQQTWFLEWVPWAIRHGHNVFFTTRMDFPKGANLAINTEAPLLGLITAPLTTLVNPVASFNLLMWLAYPLSATTMFIVIHRFTRSNVASFVGGLLYGYSTYLVGEGLGHLNLIFVPLPPLIFLALYELLVAQDKSRFRWGTALGLLAAGQFLISPEVLSTTAIIGLIGTVIIGIARRREVTRERLRYAVIGLLVALGIFIALVGYPIAYMIHGPQRFVGAVQGITNPFRADLLGPLVPSNNERLGPAPVLSLGDRFAGGVPGVASGENGSYLSAPLLLLALWGFLRYRRRQRWIGFLLALAGCAYLLSLGPYLTVAAHSTSIPLPFDLVGRLPLLWNILPSRISLDQDLFVAIAIALAVAEPMKAQRKEAERGRVTHYPLLQISIGSLCALTIASLLPRWPIPTVDIDSSVPPDFMSAIAPRIPYDTLALTYPFAISPANQSMLWQAIDRLRFSIVGGYALVPKAAGQSGASPWPPSLAPIDVQEFLGFEELGPTGYLSTTPPAINEELITSFRSYVRRYHIATVIFEPYGRNPQSVLLVMRRAFGPPTATVGEVRIWLDVDGLSEAHGA